MHRRKTAGMFCAMPPRCASGPRGRAATGPARRAAARRAPPRRGPNAMALCGTGRATARNSLTLVPPSLSPRCALLHSARLAEAGGRCAECRATLRRRASSPLGCWPAHSLARAGTACSSRCHTSLLRSPSPCSTAAVRSSSRRASSSSDCSRRTRASAAALARLLAARRSADWPRAHRLPGPASCSAPLRHLQATKVKHSMD